MNNASQSRSIKKRAASSSSAAQSPSVKKVKKGTDKKVNNTTSEQAKLACSLRFKLLQEVRIYWTNLKNEGPQLTRYLKMKDIEALREDVMTNPSFTLIQKWIQSRAINFEAFDDDKKR